MFSKMKLNSDRLFWLRSRVYDVSERRAWFLNFWFNWNWHLPAHSTKSFTVLFSQTFSSIVLHNNTISIIIGGFEGFGFRLIFYLCTNYLQGLSPHKKNMRPNYFYKNISNTKAGISKFIYWFWNSRLCIWTNSSTVEEILL